MVKLLCLVICENIPGGVSFPIQYVVMNVFTITAENRLFLI